MDLKGEQVIHKTFGNGSVESLEKGRIVIKFAGKVGTKIFMYPSGFEKYLEMCGEAAKNEVEKDLQEFLKKIKDENEEQEKKYREEQERLRLERMPKKKPTTRKAPVKKPAPKTAAKAIEKSDEALVKDSDENK